MMNKIISILTSCVLLISLIGAVLAQDTTCFNSEVVSEKEEILGPSLSYYPFSYDFGDLNEGQARKTTFQVWNSGCCQLAATFSATCSWVTVSPHNCYSSGEYVPITVAINTDGLAVGLNYCDIEINSNGGLGIFNVSVNVIQATVPILYFDPQSLDLGDVINESTAMGSFDIWNAGIDTLTYSFSEDYEWLGISPSSGSSTGEHNTIIITVNTSNLDYRQYSGEVKIDSNGGKGYFVVYVSVVVATTPVLRFYPTFYDFGEILKGDVVQTFFEIWNSGGRQLQFSLIENYDGVTVTPSEGYSDGEQVNISVVINTSRITSSHYNLMIAIDSNGGDDRFNFTITIADAINTPPTTPVVNGPKFGSQGKLSEFSCVSTDINSDRIYYNFSWDDGFFTSWLGPFDSGESCSISHIWTEKGIFEIKVQATDTNFSHTKSDWSEPYTICVDRYLNISANEAWLLVYNISNGVQIPIDIRSLELFNAERIDTQSSSETVRWFGENLFTKLLSLAFFKVFFMGDEVIVYSQNGDDSARIAQELIDHNFRGTVYNMAGGIDAWKAAGLPTISG